MEESKENAKKQKKGASNHELVSMYLYHGHSDAGAVIRRIGMFSSYIYMWKLYVDAGKFNKFN